MKSRPFLSSSQVAAFETLVSYKFRNKDLLFEALTHASKGSQRQNGFFCNERLEFLGDRVLGLIIAEKLFHTFPNEAVGTVAARFAQLVDRETLHHIALEINLGQFLSYVHDHERSPERRSITPLADACEAVIGAIYLDGGLAAAEAFVGERWSRWIQQNLQPRRDAKSKLQEWAQARGLPRPIYREVSRTGPAHLPVFVVEVSVEGLPPMVGEGFSKREAEQVVAGRLLGLVAPRDA